MAIPDVAARASSFRRQHSGVTNSVQRMTHNSRFAQIVFGSDEVLSTMSARVSPAIMRYAMHAPSDTCELGVVGRAVAPYAHPSRTHEGDGKVDHPRHVRETCVSRDETRGGRKGEG